MNLIVLKNGKKTLTLNRLSSLFNINAAKVNMSRSLLKLSKFDIIRQNLIFERNVGELVVPVEKVSVIDADPQNLIWLIPAEETYS